MDVFDIPELVVFRAHRVRCPPGWSWRSEHMGWTDLQLWIVLDGRGRMECPDQAYDLGPGGAFALRLLEPNHGSHDPAQPLEVVGINVGLRDAAGRPIVPGFGELPRHRRLDEPATIRFLGDRCVEAVEAADACIAAHWCRSILAEFVRQDTADRLLDPITPARRGAVELARRMAARPEGRFGIAEEARRLGITADHLIRSFKQVYGLPPHRYLIRKRMERAAALLSTGDLSVATVAEELGYGDPLYFSRLFMRHLGCRPSAWRTRRTGQG